MTTPENSKQSRRSVLLCALLLAAAGCSRHDDPAETQPKDWRKSYEGADDVPKPRHINHPHGKNGKPH